jgi:hypothetical protein
MGLLDNIYQNQLGRAADASGKAYWQKQLDSGTLTENQVRENIRTSSEGTNYRSGKGYSQAVADSKGSKISNVTTDGSHATDIENLYRSELGRESDATGMDYWKGIAESQGMSAVNSAFKNTAEAKGYDSLISKQGLQAPQTGAVSRSVNAETDTVQGQLNGLLDKENPLMQRAYYKGLDQANSRGILNSSMSSEGAQAAMVDAALPIAKQDASTYYDQGKTNQAYSNQFNFLDAQNQYNQDNVTHNTNESIRSGSYDVTANTQGAYLSSIDKIVNNASVSINEIETSQNIPQAEKDKMIANTVARRDADLSWTRNLYSKMPTWDLSWINLETMPAAPGLA